MSSGKKNTGSERPEDVVSNNPSQAGLAAATKEMQAAIDKLWSEMHASTHPLERIRCYEEIKKLQSEISKLEGMS